MSTEPEKFLEELKKENEDNMRHLLMDSGIYSQLAVVGLLYEEEEILINYFVDSNYRFQSSFKDLIIPSPFHKGDFYVYNPIFRHNEDDKPSYITFPTLSESLTDMVISSLEHIQRKEKGYGYLPKIREGIREKIDDFMLINGDDKKEEHE